MAEASPPLQWNFSNWEALEADIRNSAAYFGIEIPEHVFQGLKQYYFDHFPLRATRLGVFNQFQYLYSRRNQQEESDDSPESIPEEDEHSDGPSHVDSPLSDEIPPADVNEVDGSDGNSSDAYDGDACDSPTSFDDAYDDAHYDAYDDQYDDHYDNDGDYY